MATDRFKQKHTVIREDYIKWVRKTNEGIRMYTDNYIFNILGKKYFLANKTIENIVFHRV